MKPALFKNLIQEALTEIFSQSINLKEIKPNSKITILFQDNKIELKKIKDKFLVVYISNPERVMIGDIIEFIDFNVEVGMPTSCYIYRKNKIGKYKKIKMIHKFSTIKNIEIN